MRVFAYVLLIGTLGAWVLAHPVTPAAQAPGRDPAPILAAAREALGGEKRLSAVKNFVATGRTRQVRGDNLVPIEFEIAVELPDKYVRKDEIPAQESGPTSTGFNGDELIQLPVPAPPPVPAAGQGRAGAPPAPSQAQLDAARLQRVAAVKQDFVRLTLGMFAGSFSSYPLTFTYVGQAEAPQGKADVLEAKAPPNFSVQFFINTQTHLPIMVSWKQAPGRGGPGRGGPPPGEGRGRGDAPAGEGRGRGDAPAAAGRGAPPAAAPANAAPANPAPPTATPAPSPAPATPQGATPQSAPGGGPPGAPAAGAPNAGRSAAPPAPVEYRIYYADYRDVDGMQWPFRLRRATGPDTTEETTFDRFRINTKIDPKKFEVRK